MKLAYLHVNIKDDLRAQILALYILSFDEANVELPYKFCLIVTKLSYLTFLTLKEKKFRLSNLGVILYLSPSLT